MRLQQPGMVRLFEQAGRSGIYFRVVQPGTLRAGDPITLVAASPYNVTIQDMVDCNQPGPQDARKLREILALPYLSPTWRARLGN